MKASMPASPVATFPESTLRHASDDSLPGIFTGYGFYIVGVPFIAGFSALLYFFL